jgi:multidrug transporter EmrE-like cation transporter
MVLFAGVLHAGWNAVAKGLSDTRTNFGLINIGVFVFSLAVLPFTGLSSGHLLWYVEASVAIHLVYEFVLMTAYDKGDFSTSYPVARGVAPLLVSFAGVALAHEHLWIYSLENPDVHLTGLSYLLDDSERGTPVLEVRVERECCEKNEVLHPERVPTRRRREKRSDHRGRTRRLEDRRRSLGCGSGETFRVEDCGVDRRAEG